MGASSNWRSLSKSIGASSTPRKRRKLDHDSSPAASTSTAPAPESADLPRNRTTGARFNETKTLDTSLLSDKTVVNGESLGALRSMVYAPQDLDSFPERDRAPGTYIAIDCEMVGVGPDGSESSLARVSVVNYAGAVLLDVFVRQRERVTDWRTQFSGIRPADMVHAKPFDEVQKLVSDLLDGRILVGHAVHNDLHALLLSHSRAQQRDTQLLAHRHGQSKARHPALRNLAREMLGISIQEGEHSSVIDARVTMAIYRLHRKQWDRAFNTASYRVKTQQSGGIETASGTSKRKRDSLNDEQDDDDPSSKTVKIAKSGAVQRKGTSSGLTTVMKRSGPFATDGPNKREASTSKTKWWKELGGGTAFKGATRGSKGSIHVT